MNRLHVGKWLKSLCALGLRLEPRPAGILWLLSPGCLFPQSLCHRCITQSGYSDHHLVWATSSLSCIWPSSSWGASSEDPLRLPINQFSQKGNTGKGIGHPLFRFKSSDGSSGSEPSVAPHGALSTLRPTLPCSSARAPALCSPGLYCPGKQALQLHCLLVPLSLCTREKLYRSERNPLVEGLGK